MMTRIGIATLLVVLLAGWAWAGDSGQLTEAEKDWMRREAQIMARNTRRLRLLAPTHRRAAWSRRLTLENPGSQRADGRNGPLWRLQRIFSGLGPMTVAPTAPGGVHQ